MSLLKTHEAYGWSPCDQGYAEYFSGSGFLSKLKNSKIVSAVAKIAPSVQKASGTVDQLLNKPTTVPGGPSAAEIAAAKKAEEEAMEKKKKMVTYGVIGLIVVLVVVTIIVVKKKKK